MNMKPIQKAPIWFDTILWVVIICLILLISKGVMWLVDNRPDILDFILGAPHGQW